MGNRSKVIMDSIGLRIKYARQQKCFTQKQLGVAVNKGDSTVRMWELGKSEPDLLTLNLIAKTLDVNTSYLLGQVPYESTPLQSSLTISEEEAKLLTLIKQLNEDEVKELSNFVDYIISKRK